MPESAKVEEKAKQAARARLIVALDLATPAAGAALAEKLRGHVGVFKIGLELFTADGARLVTDLAARGDRVFLDLKFHDIPNTVRGAARAAARLGAAFLDIHVAGGAKMIEAALEGAREGARDGSTPRVLGVTILTSLSAEDLRQTGIDATPTEAALRLARLAQQAGLAGVVASPREAAAIREACGRDFLIVTPGIRPAGTPDDDQARATTPQAAIRAGADYVVVGRPITQAADPAEAAHAIVAEIGGALSPADWR